MQYVCREKSLNIPNMLTLLRIALLPAVVWRFELGDSSGALALYVIAMLTDALDGFLARRLNQITTLGKLLDPVADKLSLLTMMGIFVADGQIPRWLLTVMLIKEAILIVGSAAALHRGVIVHALPIGKAATAAFVASVIARFLGQGMAADVLLGVFVLLSLIALVWYSIVLLGRIMGESGRQAQRAKTV